jgi:hypothetical protein
MDLFTTTQLDASVALNAYKLYKAGNYQEAIPCLQNILDMEPANWQARLFLGASFHHLGQNWSAQSAFRYVWDNCTDADLRKKACLALQTIAATVAKKPEQTPLEFSSVQERINTAETPKDIGTILDG